MGRKKIPPELLKKNKREYMREYVKKYAIWLDGQVCSICKTADQPRITKDTCRKCYDKLRQEKRVKAELEKSYAMSLLGFKKTPDYRKKLKIFDNGYKTTEQYRLWKRKYWHYQHLKYRHRTVAK